LPITAFAVPLPPAPRRHYWPLWIGLPIIGLYALSQIEAKQSQTRQELLLPALHGGSLSTPEAFQSRCGKPEAIRTAKTGSVLDYGNILVSFPKSSDVAMVHFARKVDSPRIPDGMPADEQWAMEQLRCRL
jgi:hypothetical protein